jgi:hypothetical protein
MAEFFQAWRKRQAEKQAADWIEEQEEARRAVLELPDVLREQARLAVEKLIVGPDAEVEGALEELDQLLEPHPELRERFFHLRVVDDAVEFLRAKAARPKVRRFVGNAPGSPWLFGAVGDASTVWARR